MPSLALRPDRSSSTLSSCSVCGRRHTPSSPSPNPNLSPNPDPDLTLTLTLPLTLALTLALTLTYTPGGNLASDLRRGVGDRLEVRG